MEQLCEEIVIGMRNRGHVCHVLTSGYGVGHQLTPEEGVTRTLHLQADIHHYRPIDFFLQRPRHNRQNRELLRHAISSFQPDVIFIWGMWNLSRQVAYWAEQLLPGRVAYFVASYWLAEPDSHEAYWRLPARHSWVRALMAPARHLALGSLAQEKSAVPLHLEHVACVSEFVRSKLGEARVLPHGASVIYNGIDPAPFLRSTVRHTTETGMLRLVYTGSLVAHKGVHTAIEALGLLKQRSPADDLHLTLIGQGHPDYEAALKQKVAALGLEAQVTFSGRVPRADIPGLLAKHDVFLFTSIWEEPIARTMMEAMAAGLAIIGTPVGGQPEILEAGVNGLTFPPEDADSLAACILQLRCDPDLRRRLAEAGRNTVLERFSLKRMTENVGEWLESVAA